MLFNHLIPFSNMEVMAFQSKGVFHWKYILTTHLRFLTCIFNFILYGLPQSLNIFNYLFMKQSSLFCFVCQVEISQTMMLLACVGATCLPGWCCFPSCVCVAILFAQVLLLFSCCSTILLVWCYYSSHMVLLFFSCQCCMFFLCCYYYFLLHLCSMLFSCWCYCSSCISFV